MKKLISLILLAALMLSVLAVPVLSAALAVPQWISGDTKAAEKPAPVLTRTFELAERPKCASLELAVAGWCEVTVNGARVGEDVLSPVTCQPDKRLSSLTLDAGEAVAYPVLTLLGSLALNDVELKLVSDGKAPGASQWLVRSTGLSGEFKSVEGGRVKYLTDGVKLAGNGGLILLLK